MLRYWSWNRSPVELAGYLNLNKKSPPCKLHISPLTRTVLGHNDKSLRMWLLRGSALSKQQKPSHCRGVITSLEKQSSKKDTDYTGTAHTSPSISIHLSCPPVSSALLVVQASAGPQERQLLDPLKFAKLPLAQAAQNA